MQPRAAATDKTQTLPPVVTSAALADSELQRTQSARIAPERRPDSKSPLNDVDEALLRIFNRIYL